MNSFDECLQLAESSHLVNVRKRPLAASRGVLIEGLLSARAVIRESRPPYWPDHKESFHQKHALAEAILQLRHSTIVGRSKK
jgi:hypothetical protein